MVNKIFRKGKAFLLAYDQGMEHGPDDLDDFSANPDNLFNLAIKGKATGIIVHKGIAKKYYSKYKGKIPLIIKLNGKTKLGDKHNSRQLCTVAEAKKLGASAVGYTVYLGSDYEADMMQEFAKIIREAKKHKLLCIGWMYPRGGKVIHRKYYKNAAYAARVGMELGADATKIMINNPSKVSYVKKMCSGVKVLVAGGDKTSQRKFLKNIQTAKESGADGFAIGRNIWQSKEPLKLMKEVKKIIWN